MYKEHPVKNTDIPILNSKRKSKLNEGNSMVTVLYFTIVILRSCVEILAP